MPQKIGFIGMGIMGQPMSKNLLKAGYDVMVYNRSSEKTKPLAESGAKAASSLLEIARHSDVVILMLTGPEAIDSVIHEKDGLLNNMKHKTIINMSTVSPAYSRQLNGIFKNASIHFIDAPVSGSKKPAEDAALIILASGSKEKVNDYESLLLKMGKKVVYCGEAGQGSSMKMVVNLLLGIMMEGFCESVNFGQKCGLSIETIIETILSGPLSCGLFNLKTDMLKNRTYPAQFPFKHMAKDLRFVLQTADEKGASIPVGHTIYQIFRQGIGHDLGDMDFAAVKKVLEQISDV